MRRELRLAEQYDAAARHDAAIEALARGARMGSVEAMTRLGKRLLIGDRAPCLPGDGARFLIDATEAGGPEAAERFAVLTATGAHVLRSWPDALAALALSAERGWMPARGQLCALAPDRLLAARVVAESEAQRGGSPARSLWAQLADSIEVLPATGAERAITLSAEPIVKVFPEFITDAVCDWIVSRARPKLSRALVYNSTAGRDTRCNSVAIFNLLDTDLVQIATQTRIAVACGFPFQNLEASAVLHYHVGEHMRDHYDFIDPASPAYAQEWARQGQRRMTFLIYLNDGYDGGETAFPRLAIRHRGARRSGLCFTNAHNDGTPDIRSLHAGLPPTRGEKWIVSQFIRDRGISESSLPHSLY